MIDQEHNGANAETADLGDDAGDDAGDEGGQGAPLLEMPELVLILGLLALTIGGFLYYYQPLVQTMVQHLLGRDRG